MSQVVVGTSGWSYDHWAGSFYPQGLARSHWFDHYTSRFDAVEINYSFYRLPSEDVVASWKKRAPDGFRFALKGSRYITHRLRLRDSREAVSLFCGRARGLGDQLGAVLWQLPGDLVRDEQLLDGFLSTLPPSLPHAIEFRHASWLSPHVSELLRAHGVALVWVSSMEMPLDFTVTAGFVYARFHGLDGGGEHDYTADELGPWVTALHGEKGFAFFNNDAKGMAPANAALLRRLLDG